MSQQTESKTKDNQVVKNSAWNFIGQVIPLAVAVFSIPILIKGIGTERFGILTLAWMITGYFSLFDLGLGRALTQLVSEKIVKNLRTEVPDIIQTVLLLMFVFGVLAAGLFAAASPYAVEHLMKVPQQLQDEVLLSAWIVAATIPFVLATTALKGALEAVHRFDLINLIRLPLGIFSYLLPVLVLPFSQNLPAIMYCILFVRIVGYFAHQYYCLKIFPDLILIRPLRKGLIKPLFSFGSWMTVSNIISPIMVQMDRFYIGSVVSLSSVSFYATPYEMVIKLWIFPTSLSSTLFPTFAKALHIDKNQVLKVYLKSCRYLYMLLLPIVIILCLFAQEILKLWINEEFALHSYTVLQILSLGVLINAIASVPFTLVQAAGRPDITAKFHMLELPVYVVLLWYLTSNFGINGAAVAWTIRVTLDGLLLAHYASHSIFEKQATNHLAKLTIVLVATIAVFAGLFYCTHILTWPQRIPLALSLFGLLFWIGKKYFDHDDRQQLLNYWHKFFKKKPQEIL